MQIQNNSQLNFNGKAYNKEAHYLHGKMARVADRAVARLNEMEFVKNAECDILLFQCGNSKKFDVIAQKISDYGPNNKPFWRRCVTTERNVGSIIESAKQVISEYNEKVLPLHQKPKEYKPVLDYYDGVLCVSAEPLPKQEQSTRTERLKNLGKKILIELFT